MQLGLSEAYGAGRDFADEPITHLFAGPFKRTWQTLLVISLSAAVAPTAEVHEEIPEIGSDELFNSWKQKGVKFGGDRSNLRALREDLPESDFAQAKIDALNGVGKMFISMLNDGEVGLAVGHSPVIELACAQLQETPTDFQLKENEYVVFEEDDDGVITVSQSVQ